MSYRLGLLVFELNRGRKVRGQKVHGQKIRFKKILNKSSNSVFIVGQKIQAHF